MQETESSTQTPRPRRYLRRIIFACVVLLVLLVLALVPPLISVNRLQRRISRSISNSIGRTAHVDDVTLNILPWPSFTLKNLVIDDDPTFSNEPIIRANLVTARLRLTSLWRHQVEFSTIRFEVDPNGSGPSVNLVRNNAGQWNLQSILVQAAQVNAAPTGQPAPGPAPRFPYIEATGARVNIKRGPEKLPLSLTEAEFALSLTNPQQWHLSLKGRPVRTDTTVSDPGVLRIEGTLNRAASFSDVPIDLVASWQKVPLGEVTRILTGNDAGWRGDLNFTANITGTLGATLLATHVQVADLHRDAFAPSHALPIDLRCNAKTSFLTRAFNNIECLLPLDPVAGRQVLLTGDLADVHQAATAHWNLAVSKVPAAWCLEWARLFSQRIPSSLAPEGDVTGNLARTDAGWAGTFHTELAQNAADNTPLSLAADLQLGAPPASAASAVKGKRGSKPVQAPASPWVSDPPAGTLLLLPSTLHLGKTAQATVTAGFTASGYNFHLDGSAPPTKLLLFDPLLPTATASVAELFPTPIPQTPQHLDITCTRNWDAPTQSCEAAVVEKPAPKHRRR